MSQSTSPSLAEQVGQLRDLLCRLEPREFETLLERSLEEILDRRVYPFKSGYQFGADMGTDPLDPPTIRLEAKRYQKKLDQRSLLGEIDQVTDHDAELDLWIVGTTAAVGMNDVDAIRRSGIHHRIGIEVIDLAESKKPKLPQVLWLALPTAVAYVEETLDAAAGQELQALMRSLAERHGFDDSIRDELIHATNLFDTIADLMRQDLRRRLDDTRLSLRRFNQVIHDTSVFVPRPRLTDSIDRWFEQGDERADLCLIKGAAGVGKSWIVFEALGRLAEAHRLLPIVLTAKDARRVHSLEEAMASRIADVMPQLKVSAWRRRIQRWLANSLRYKILLFFDGLNEEPKAPWHRLLDEASIPDVPVSFHPRRSDAPPMFPLATLATCRSQFWQAHFSDRPGVHAIRVDAFSRAELQACLERGHRHLDDFQKEVQELMRIPKITGAVIRRYPALKASEEITVDRLLHEEWKHHREQKRGSMFAEGEFRALLQDLAKDFVRGKILHRSHEIRRILGPQEAEKNLVELTTSGILEPAGDGKHRLEASRLYHSLGFLLYQELSEEPEGEVSMHRENIEARLESARGLDAHAPILAAAIFAAVIEAERPKAVLFALLQSFACLRNVSRLVRDRVDGYLPAMGTDLLELAEHSVLHPKGSHQTFELVERILIIWSRKGIADALIRRACHRWIGFLRWKSTSQYEPPSVLKQRSERLEKLLGRPPATGTFENHGATFRVVERGGVSRLHRLAITLVSARGGRIEPEFFRDWALVEVVDGFFLSENAQIPWLLRFLALRATDALLETVEGMLAVENPLWQEAAYWLSDLIADPRAEDLKGRSNFRPAHYGEEADSVKPCDGADWRSLPRCFEHPEIRLRTKAQRLDGLALDPSFELPQEIAETLIPRLARAAQVEYGDQENEIKAHLAFARWCPAVEADVWLRGLRRFDRDIAYGVGDGSDDATGGAADSEEDEERRREHQHRLRLVHGWAHHYQHLILILEGQDVESAELVWRRHVRQPKANRDLAGLHLQDPTEIELLRALLLVADAELCVELILQRPAGEGSASRCLRALPLELTPEQARQCWRTLMERTDEEILEKLQLLATDTPRLDPEALRRLIEIAEKDRSGAAEVAAFAQLSGNATLIRGLIDSGVGLRLEAVDGAYKLGYPGLGSKMPMVDLLAAAPANFASFFMAERGDEEIALFAEAVRAFPRRGGPGWHQQLGRRHLRNSYRFDQAALSKALDLHPDVLDHLMAALDTYEQDAESPLQHSHHLYVAVCDYLMTREPDRALRLLDALLRVERATESILGSTTRKPSDLCWRLMVKHADLLEVSRRLERDLDALTDDTSLEALAQLFEPPGDHWLWRKIETDARSERQLQVARAMTLASYAHDAERAVALLERLEGQVRGWLGRVRRAALAVARNGLWSCHWFDQFLRRPDPKESWAAFRLFLHCVDRRFRGRHRSALNAASARYPDRSRRVSHLRANIETIDAMIDERWKKLTKDRFCHTETPRGVFPWMGTWKYPVRYDRQMVSGRVETEDPPGGDKGA